MELLIKNGDTELYTLAYPGKGEETILLLHGGPAVPDGLTFLRQFFHPRFQVIFFHQRGTFRSPTASHDYSIDAYVSDVNRIAEVFGLRQFHLFGHSWGGLYADIFAHRHP